MNSEIGIEGVANLIGDALLKHCRTGAFMLGGYSVGCYVAFETSRLLAHAGRTVKGLLLIDMPCPHPYMASETSLIEQVDRSEEILDGIVDGDDKGKSLSPRREHMRQFFLAMHEYSPQPMKIHERPHKVAVIWARRGLVDRVAKDASRIEKLENYGLPTTGYAGFMQDSTLGPFARNIPDKGEEALRPNGWDRHTAGDVTVRSVDADHFQLAMPSHVHLLQAEMENVLAEFNAAE